MPILILFSAMLAQADATGSDRLRALFACRVVAEAGERLRCYDTGVATLEQAEREGEVVVTNRRTADEGERAVQATRAAEAAMQAFDSRLSVVSQNARGLYTLTLEDGSRWVQVDRRRLSAEPRVGQGVAMRPAAFGAFVARIENAIGFRVRRVR